MLGIEIMKRIGGSGGSAVAHTDSPIVLVDTTYDAQYRILFGLGADGFTYVMKNFAARYKSVPWINPQAGMTAFQVRATQVSGDVPGGAAIGAWLDFSVIRSWFLLTADTGPKSCLLTLEIRRVSDSVVVKTVSLYLATTGVSG